MLRELMTMWKERRKRCGWEGATDVESDELAPRHVTGCEIEHLHPPSKPASSTCQLTLFLTVASE
jgi:hypothetical protein